MAQLLKPNLNKSRFSERNSRVCTCSRIRNRIRLSNSKCGSKKKRLIYLLGVNSKDDERESKKIIRRKKQVLDGNGVAAGVPFSSSSTSVGFVEGGGIDEGQFGYLVSEFGWKVRRLIENEDEMREVVQVQAEAFHVPMAFFNEIFFEFFKVSLISYILSYYLILLKMFLININYQIYPFSLCQDIFCSDI